MKILTRDDTEHDVEYVTRADAEREIEAWKEKANLLERSLKCASIEIALRQQIREFDLMVRLYNIGYHAGHEHTVEACFTPIDHADMNTYHADVVAEILKDTETEQATTPAERPTPITDDHEEWSEHHGKDVVESDVCRDLERQLAESREQVRVGQDFIVTLRCELDALAEEVKAAKLALAAVKGDTNA